MATLHALGGAALLFPVEAAGVTVGYIDVAVGLEDRQLQTPQDAVEQLATGSFFNVTTVRGMWTCGVGPLGGTSPAVLGANAPSLQQSLEGAVLPGWGDTAEPLGTAQGVNATGLPGSQHRRAAGSIVVPRGPTCPQWIPAGGTDLEGAQAVRPSPRSAVSNQQQNNGC